jgi:hypothetical protein
VVAWATFVLIRNSSMPFTYGLGGILLIALFYSLFMPVGRAWSVDNLLDTRGARPVDATWSIVVFRLHLCVIYAAAGFSKAMGADWWSGEAMWRALSLPQFRQFDPSPLASFPLLLQVGSIVAILSQLLYPVLVWTRLRVAIVVPGRADAPRHRGLPRALALLARDDRDQHRRLRRSGVARACAAPSGSGPRLRTALGPHHLRRGLPLLRRLRPLPALRGGHRQAGARRREEPARDPRRARDRARRARGWDGGGVRTDACFGARTRCTSSRSSRSRPRSRGSARSPP